MKWMNDKFNGMMIWYCCDNWINEWYGKYFMYYYLEEEKKLCELLLLLEIKVKFSKYW